MERLKLSGVSKSFGPVRALRAVSFDLRAGEIHALVGENGAGKSTLIRIATGAHRPDSGLVEIDGRGAGELTPLRAKRLGVAAVYQQPALFSALSVAENLAEPAEAWAIVDWKRRRARARELLGQIGARIDPDRPAGELSMAEQQLVEIARAVGAGARVLILDEPTAALPEAEARRLFEILRSLRSRGAAVLFISHRLDEVFELADRITVLRDGAVVATRAAAEIDRCELIRLMVGRRLSAVSPPREPRPGEIVLETRRLCGGRVRDVSLVVRAGEILGIAGLVGAGRTELARLLFGLAPVESGEIFIRGRLARIDSPRRAVEHGIGYVPEDRRRHGVIPEMSIAANVSLAAAKGGIIDRDAETRRAEEFREILSIRAGSVLDAVSTLSGGNQQKVALARWLSMRPSVLILDEPTQGIDVAARAEIHRLVGELASRGMAILMISSDLPEVLGLSDRVAVMRAGSISATLERGQATAERVMAHAA
jgi:rhamnose transport system ATP-binding protein